MYKLNWLTRCVIYLKQPYHKVFYVAIILSNSLFIYFIEETHYYNTEKTYYVAVLQHNELEHHGAKEK